MQSLGVELQEEANLKPLTHDVVKSAAIEGGQLDPPEVRSSLARRRPQHQFPACGKYMKKKNHPTLPIPSRARWARTRAPIMLALDPLSSITEGRR